VSPILLPLHRILHRRGCFTWLAGCCCCAVRLDFAERPPPYKLRQAEHLLMLSAAKSSARFMSRHPCRHIDRHSLCGHLTHLPSTRLSRGPAAWKLQTLSTTFERSDRAYKLTSSDVVVTYGKGFHRPVQSISINVFHVRRSTWETINNGWIVVAVVSALAVVLGIRGLIAAKSTGIYSVVAVGLIVVGVIMPYLL